MVRGPHVWSVQKADKNRAKEEDKYKHFLRMDYIYYISGDSSPSGTKNGKTRHVLMTFLHYFCIYTVRLDIFSGFKEACR